MAGSRQRVRSVFFPDLSYEADDEEATTPVDPSERERTLIERKMSKQFREKKKEYLKRGYDAKTASEMADAYVQTGLAMEINHWKSKYGVKDEDEKDVSPGNDD